MEFDLSWVLLGLPIAFVLGWLASRLDLRQLRIENRLAPKAYFRGLNHMLNEQQDQAIDAFIEAVQKDPETSELHFALGNLFRRRGEYERAIRVHEHLLSRTDLSRNDLERAQYALAQDFLKAGLLDRAEEALRKLEHTQHQEQAWLTLLALHERARDWERASAIAFQLQQSGHADFGGRLSHYLCEQAEHALHKQKESQIARDLLERAIHETPGAARPRIQLAGMLADQGRPGDACDQLDLLQERAPHAVALIASEWVQLGQASGKLAEVVKRLEQAYQDHPSVDIADALVQARVHQGVPIAQAREGYVDHMRLEPSLIAASRWTSHEAFAQDEAHRAVQQSIEQAARPLARYRCAACGFETQGYFWRCPGCQAWESFPPRRIEEL